MARLHHDFNELHHHKVSGEFSNGHENQSKNRRDPEETQAQDYHITNYWDE